MKTFATGPAESGPSSGGGPVSTPAAERPGGSLPYVLGEVLGGGGMGDVWRAWDPSLGRHLAVKVLRDPYRHGALFKQEAEITAQLDHPAIVRVFARGRLEDGRPWFAMEEVKGTTLAQVGRDADRPLDARVAIVERVADAVALAHSRGIVHRDLKPENVMIDTFDHVRVLDWGLADSVGAPHDGHHTPGFAAPEHVGGAPLDPRADVYALGVTLRRVAGETPEIEAICAQATAPFAERLPDAGALAAALRGWLEQHQRRGRAVAEVEAGRLLEARIEAARARSAELTVTAAAALRRLKPYAPETEKAPLWRIEEEARRHVEEAERLEVEMIGRYQAALTHVYGFADAHRALADLYRRRHQAAERERNPAEMARYEALLRQHDRGEHQGYLEGVAHISLRTAPAAEVQLFRYEEHNRRLVPRLVGSVGSTPLDRLRVPAGSYALHLSAPGCEPAVVAVRVDRQHHHLDVDPTTGAPLEVRLPPAGCLGPEDVFIPPGYGRQGGDPIAYAALPAELAWCDAFVIRRYPVRQREYIEFLDDLVARGREDEALRHVPRLLAPNATEGGDPLYARDPAGRFYLTEDPQGTVWQPEWPAMMVTWHSAEAYARWYAERTGLPWRLPREREWERAARGVDGRIYPWGDFFDASWCSMRQSKDRDFTPEPVETYPVDESPYGVRGMAGNVRDWCKEAYSHDGVEPEQSDNADLPRVVRGGAYFYTDVAARATSRHFFSQRLRLENIGFRLVRSVGGAW